MINRVCVFAHYDKDNTVDEYVYYYLNELLTIVQKLVFVTVSDISEKDVMKLKNLDIEVIKRENIGYDFYSYKVGIEQLDLNLYDELIVCNDSVFGPIIPMKNIFTKMQDGECDFWGITDSKDIAYHLQSYFLVFRKKILKSHVFSDFWNQLKILEDKNEIITRYEIGMSQVLLKKNYRPQAYIDYRINKKDNIVRLLKRLMNKPHKFFNLVIFPYRYFSTAVKKNGNSSLNFWDKLLIKHQLPFIKKSLILDKSQSGENIKKLKVIFQKKLLKTDYPIDFIERYYGRNR